MTRKLLLCLTGEAFRFGPQMSREKGGHESIIRQKMASETHLKFIDFIKNKFNIEVDTFLFTYYFNEEYNNILKDIYPNIFFKDSPSPCEEDFHNWIFLHFPQITSGKEYSHALFIRVDLYLKKYFFETFDLPNDKILLGFPDVNSGSNSLSSCHSLFLISNNFFHDINLWMPHIAFKNFLSKYGKEKVDFFVKTPHILSTDLGWNPLFIQVGRKYSNKLIINGYAYSKRDIIFSPELSEFIDNKEEWIKYDKHISEENFENIFT